MNPQNISYIVNSTLKRFGVNEPSVERLIKGTFLMESQLTDMFDSDSRLYGFMMLSEKEVERIYNEYLTYNKRLANKLKKASCVDFSKIGLEDFKELLKFNVSFMVSVLYIYYTMEFQDIPEPDLHSIAKTYTKYYLKTISPELEQEFVDYYREVFNK